MDRAVVLVARLALRDRGAAGAVVGSLRGHVARALLQAAAAANGAVAVVALGANLAVDGALDLVDLGTGSGAILLALLSERPGWRGLGIDLSTAALAVARDNAGRTGLANRARFAAASWSATLPDSAFDVVVSNPPYIAADVLAGLDPEVRDHEPRMALDGGADGLDAYRILTADLVRILKPGGLFAFEIGHDQALAVSALARAAGLTAVAVLPDLAGRDRVVLGQAPAAPRDEFQSRIHTSSDKSERQCSDPALVEQHPSHSRGVPARDDAHAREDCSERSARARARGIACTTVPRSRR